MNDDYKTEREIELEKEIAKGDKIIGELFRESTEVINKNKELKTKLDIAVKALKLARDTAYSSTQDCQKCAFIDEILSEALAKIKEIK